MSYLLHHIYKTQIFVYLALWPKCFLLLHNLKCLLLHVSPTVLCVCRYYVHALQKAYEKDSVIDLPHFPIHVSSSKIIEEFSVTESVEQF
jgi:hypothetical protein